ncbi:amidohydrolase family protein [Halocola ammonii]
MKNLILTFGFCAALFQLFGQTTYPNLHTRSKDVVYTAITNATIQVDPETKIEGGTLLMAGDSIVAVGKTVKIPKNTEVIDLKGKFIYPAFIDLYSQYGISKVEKKKRSPRPQYESEKEGAFAWNQAIKPEVDASSMFTFDESEAKSFRKIGFGAVLTHQQDGIVRGTSALVTLGENENLNLIRPKAAAQYSFSKGVSQQAYPSSLMGAIALLRQTFYDAQWYSSPLNTEEKNLSLNAFNSSMELPQILESYDKFELLTADRVGDEFDTQFILVGNGDEYQRLEEIKATEASLIIPLEFPKPYDVSDPFLARMVSLEEMKHWELAPKNPAFLEEAEIEFAFTTHGLDKKDKFLENLRKAVEYGLSEKTALAALTTVPAGLINSTDEVGSLEAGKLANFIVTSGDIFKKETKIHENWVQGQPFVVEASDDLEVSGKYNLNLKGQPFPFSVEKKGDDKYEAFIQKIEKNAEGESDTTKVKVNFQRENQLLTMYFQLDTDQFPGITRLGGNITSKSRIWEGKGETADGRWFDWAAIKQSAEPDSTTASSDSTETETLELGNVIYPFVAYGRDSMPEESENLWIRNATIWTCDSIGTIENGEMLVRNGKIVAVGQSLSPNSIFPKEQIDWQQVDARDKHITPGIIDEHSHIAIRRGVNESGEAVTSEVRIGDAINADDINIYRQLAGGVTTSQLLHGSANPIGGQSAIIKLRWGMAPEEMKFDSAAPFIKFALGENVKQSNWGDYYRVRFPQTRMGVEQTFYDAFIAASEYGNEWSEYESKLENRTWIDKLRKRSPQVPRRDLELEALWEILNSERFITCHSYMQHEINMLMHVADSMGFTVNTFTHILEGYKLADKMEEHGAAGSTFSDWWAYKFEVNDAIPFNGALMWQQGVLTAFNSDDAEMARRLNQEAAKAVKYGGVPEEEALKFVTLNPAKMLHIDKWVGSLKEGKDADFVIWSGHPLSVYSKAEKTYIEGTCYYDRSEESAEAKAIAQERARLIQKMLDAKKNGAETQKPKAEKDKHYHCDTYHDEGGVQR